MNQANHHYDEVLKKWRAILEEELDVENETSQGIRSALNEITVWISGPHRWIRLVELKDHCSASEVEGVKFAIGAWRCVYECITGVKL